MRPRVLMGLLLGLVATPGLANALGENVPRPAIPLALHGVFATDPAGCRRQDHDGRIEITEREVRFYELTARPDQLLELPGGAVVIWADVEGEDAGWNELLAFLPAPNGGLVRLIASDGHAGPSRVDYVRCPGARR